MVSPFAESSSLFPTFLERIYEDAIKYFLPNQSTYLIPRGVEFQQKFLYISMVMDKKYFEKVILSHPKDNVATARIVIEPGALLALDSGSE